MIRRMPASDRFVLRAIATVRSPLADPSSAPKQAHEGAPQAWLEFDESVLDGLDGLHVGDRVLVLTWLHRADRSVLAVPPRDDLERPLQGVFATRSPARPNPIGLHEVEIIQVDDGRVLVDALEAVDGTPVLDVKPALKRS